MIGKLLKEIRESKGFTQEFVAKHLYVSRQTISRWEQDKTLPNIYALEKLSDLYDTPIEQMIKNDYQERRKQLNYFALFGAIMFNIILYAIVIIGVIPLLLSIWLLSIIFLLSPFIFIVFVFLSIQKFEFLQFFISLIFFSVGLFMLPLLKRGTVKLATYFHKYLKYNHKSIYLNN